MISTSLTHSLSLSLFSVISAPQQKITNLFYRQISASFVCKLQIIELLDADIEHVPWSELYFPITISNSDYGTLSMLRMEKRRLPIFIFPNQ